MTSHQRAVKLVNQWYNTDEAREMELINAVTTALQAQSNDDLTQARRDRERLQERLAECERVIVSLRATREKMALRESRLIKLVNQIFVVVSPGAYKGFDYTNAIATIKTLIMEYKV